MRKRRRKPEVLEVIVQAYYPAKGYGFGVAPDKAGKKVLFHGDRRHRLLQGQGNEAPIFVEKDVLTTPPAINEIIICQIRRKEGRFRAEMWGFATELHRKYI